MRLLKNEISEQDELIIENFMKDKDNSKWLHYFGTYFDVLGLLSSTRSYYNLHDIMNVSVEDGFVPIIEKIIRLRNSLVMLGKTDFVKDLRKEDFEYTKKANLMLKIFKKVLGDKAKQDLDNSQGNPKQDEDDEEEEQDGQCKPKNEPKDAPKNENKETLDQISKKLDVVSSALENTANALDVAYQSPEKEEDEDGGKKSSNQKTGSQFSLAEKSIDLLINMSRNNMEDLLRLISTYKHFLDGTEHKKEVLAPIGEMKFKKMTSFKELKYIRKNDWMLPDEVFDAKLARKDFILERPVHRKKNFNIYVVADISGSMGGVRMTFLISLLVALGRQALKSKSKITVLPFSGNVYPSIVLDNNWIEWSNKILRLHAMDSTCTYEALVKAYSEVTNEELVLITDATEDSFPSPTETPKKLKKHCVVLNESDMDLKSFHDYFDSVVINETRNMKQAEKVGLQLLKVLK